MAQEEDGQVTQNSRAGQLVQRLYVRRYTV